MDTFNPSPVNPSQMPPMPSAPVEKKSSVGALVAVIVILALIIIGGLYFLKERSIQKQEVYVPPTVEEGDAITASLNKQDSSDELNSIEADLNAVDFNNLDQGAAAIEAELQ